MDLGGIDANRRLGTTPNHQEPSTATTQRPSDPEVKEPKPNYKTNTTRYPSFLPPPGGLPPPSSTNHQLTNTPIQSLTLQEAEDLVLRTLKQVMEEKLDSRNVQLASVTKEKGFRIYTDEEMAAVVQRL